MAAHWLCERPFVTPPQNLSSIDIKHADRDDLCPLSSAEGLIVVCQEKVAASVSGLRGLCVPLHVAGFIALIIVGSLNRMLRRRARANISVERGEIIDPRFKHCDSASAISLIGGIVQIQTATFNVRPDAVLRAIGHAMSNRLRFSRTFTAGFYKSRSQVGGAYFRDAATIAKTFPVPTARSTSGECFYGEFSETGFKGYIDSGWHVLAPFKNVLARLSGFAFVGPFPL